MRSKSIVRDTTTLSLKRAYSFDMNCVECLGGKSNWWKYLLVAYLPLTIFYLLVLFFNVNATSSVLYGFVVCCQSIAIPVVARAIIMASKGQSRGAQMAIRTNAFFYGIWNLDFFRSFNLGICLQIDTLQTLTLDIAIGFYPLLLIILTYFLVDLHGRNFRPVVVIWEPISNVLHLFHNNWEIRTS